METEPLIDQVELLTVTEAAQLKGVSRAAIYIAIKEGRLSHLKVLGHLALRRAEVLAWVPSPRQGRRQGTRLSVETKAKISAGRKRYLAQRATADGTEGEAISDATLSDATADVPNNTAPQG